ncbi:MAG TPA: DUF3297 family protein [Allosphingosinicella sp.]|jgi:hypothetical protein|nr:DUF3297 family protein [Allosphingosinicella sp.]
MADTPPDRLSLNPRSPFFDGELLRRGVGIRFKGKERTDVEEYSVSEGWIRVAAGRSMDRYGQPMTIKLKGEVEPFFQDMKGSEEEAAEEGAQEGGAAQDA